MFKTIKPTEILRIWKIIHCNEYSLIYFFQFTVQNYTIQKSIISTIHLSCDLALRWQWQHIVCSITTMCLEIYKCKL